MIKIDAYDKKILEILINNSREQITTIAKKVRLKRETVNYKINRLINLGLIKEFNLILNEKKLGLTHYTVFIELTNLKGDTEKEILDYLEKNQHMSWIGTAAGKWSLVFDIILHERIKLDEAIRELLLKFGKYIGEYTILRTQDAEYYNLKPLGIFKKTTEKKENKETPNLNEKDFKILSILNQNARTNFVSISSKVGLTPNGIIQRVKNLERKQVIEGYTTSVDWKKLDYEWYGLQIKLTKFNAESAQEIVKYLRTHKKVIFYNKYLGEMWDYDFGILVKNSEEVRDFINEFRTKFFDIMKIHDVFLVLGEVSGFKLPQGVFEC
jgi:Lrp/AsnC family transcriptional regulator, leucine-responsive regulatory protein